MIFGFLACVVMLLLLERFGLELRRPLEQRGQRVEVPTRTLAAVVGVVLAVAAFATWADVGLKLHLGASHIRPTVTRVNLLPAPPDMKQQIGPPITEVPGLFGSGAIGRFITFNRGPISVTAQVLVAPSYDVANRYGVKNCFTQHAYKIYSTHHAPLPGGGTAELVAIHYGTRDYATINWTQPVTIDGRRAWRRVVLFEALRPTPRRPDAATGDRASARSGSGSSTSSRRTGASIRRRASTTRRRRSSRARGSSSRRASTGRSALVRAGNAAPTLRRCSAGPSSRWRSSSARGRHRADRSAVRAATTTGAPAPLRTAERGRRQRAGRRGRQPLPERTRGSVVRCSSRWPRSRSSADTCCSRAGAASRSVERAPRSRARPSASRARDRPRSRADAPLPAGARRAAALLVLVGFGVSYSLAAAARRLGEPGRARSSRCRSRRSRCSRLTLARSSPPRARGRHQLRLRRARGAGLRRSCCSRSRRGTGPSTGTSGSTCSRCRSSSRSAVLLLFGLPALLRSAGAFGSALPRLEAGARPDRRPRRRAARAPRRGARRRARLAVRGACAPDGPALRRRAGRHALDGDLVRVRRAGRALLDAPRRGVPRPGGAGDGGGRSSSGSVRASRSRSS